MKSKKESVQDLLLGEFYGICYSAYSNTSFSPEVRAVNVIKEYSSLLESDLNELGENKGNYKTKFINHFTAWMNAKGNCISVMITGGSNFPVRRAEKANASERNKYVAFQNWREKYFKAVNRVPTKSPEEDLIIAERRFEGCLNLQIQMKEINSFCNLKCSYCPNSQSERKEKGEMKHLIFILFLGISCFGYSTKGFDYYRYSLLYGKIYKNDLFYYSLEFNLHKRFVGRHYRGNYHGIGASIDYGKDYQSFGLKGMLNPTYIEFELTRRIRFHPYIWIQGNLVRKDEKLIKNVLT